MRQFPGGILEAQGLKFASDKRFSEYFGEVYDRLERYGNQTDFDKRVTILREMPRRRGLFE